MIEIFGEVQIEQRKFSLLLEWTVKTFSLPALKLTFRADFSRKIQVLVFQLKKEKKLKPFSPENPWQYRSTTEIKKNNIQQLSLQER